MLAILIVISIGNFMRLRPAADPVRTVDFLSIFVIGALSALLIREVAEMLRKPKE
jgi:hypothetical protein